MANLTTLPKKASIWSLCPILLLALLTASLLYVFFFAPASVTLDGYSHLYEAKVLSWMLHSQPWVHRYFSYNSPLLPNWLCTLLLVGLSNIVPDELALKILIVLSVVLSLFSLYYCVDARQYSRPQRAQVLIILLPFALNAYLTLGFYGFLISSSMCIFVLGMFLRHGLGMPLRFQLVAACLLLVAYSSHPLPVLVSFLFPWTQFISEVAVEGRYDSRAVALKRVVVALWPWILPACAILWFYLRLTRTGQPQAYSLAENVRGRIIELARDALLSISPSPTFGTLFIALLALLLASVLLRPRRLLLIAGHMNTALANHLVACSTRIDPKEQGASHTRWGFLIRIVEFEPKKRRGTTGKGYMAKNIYMLIVLVTYPAYAQIVSGTSIIFNFTEDKFVVAADSRTVHDNTGAPDNSYCKIAAFSHQFIFATVGGLGYAKGPSETIENWTNVGLARDAIHDVPSATNGEAHMDAIAAYWAKAVVKHWSSLCALDRLRCVALTEAHQGALTSGIFLGAEGLLLSAATVFFDAAHLGDPVGYQTGKRMAHCWSCGQEQGKQICAAGSHIDVAAKFCSKRKPHSQIRTRTPLQGASEDAKLPVKIAELTIDAYEKSPGDVGGKVDVVLLTKGRIHWLQRKPNCPENQD